jgi:hypothetical protein
VAADVHARLAGSLLRVLRLGVHNGKQ